MKKDKELISKFRAIEREITQEKGPFTLFALIQRQGAWDSWDVVVAAPWIGDNLKETLNYLVEQIRKVLHKEELLKLSRIVPLAPSESFVEEILAEWEEYGDVGLRNIDINGGCV